MKRALILYLESRGFAVTDLENHRFDPKDDYPEIAASVARRVQQQVGSRGILICRNGVGVNIVANKFTGIRATISTSVKHARSTRADDDTNILCLGQDYTTTIEAKKIVSVWLSQKFSGLARHKRRLAKLQKIERAKR